MTAYYNEHDRGAAAWLRELIKSGLIAPGVVDERSISDVRPADLAGYTQCHFFAGIGVWSYALRLAGWSDDRPVWTGSCPCQPFSDAGKGGGFADERHLWPAWFQLIAQCRPPVVFGEQVASKDGLGWFDLVHTNLEDADYAVGAADLCAAGVGAPHIRQRLYFVADDQECGRIEECANGGRQRQGDRSQGWAAGFEPGGDAGGLADAGGQRLVGQHVRLWEETVGRNADDLPQITGGGGAGGLGGQRSDPSNVGELGDADNAGLEGRPSEPERPDKRVVGPQRVAHPWSDVEWIPCRDGKFRPTQPGLQPLAHGAAARVVRLRGYGNGLVAPAAAAFISSYLDTL